MVRKKRGSSLVTVVIISGILVTVGTAMLSMTVGEYKMRTTESTRIENLYSSESGLDVAYDILIKTFDAAAIYGVNQVEKYKKTEAFITYVAKDFKDDIVRQEKAKAEISSDDPKRSSKIKACNKQIALDNENIKIDEDLAINAYFKNKFNEFIYKDSSADMNINELKRCIEGHKYAINLDKEKRDERDYTTVDFNNSNPINPSADVNTENIKLDSIDFKGTPNGDYTKGKYPNGICPNGKYIITIKSEYTTTDKGPKGDKTTRKLQSTYDMTLPEYKDVVFSESEAEVTKQPFLIDKALIVGKDMNVAKSPLTVTGDVFVEGVGRLTNDVNTRAYDKYNGGIVLDADSKKAVTFTGDIITGQTFNIRNKVDATINGNLYAMNVYAGSKKENDPLSQDSTLNVVKNGDKGGEVVVDNDITLKASDTHLEMDKFYGINDKNIKYSDATGINGTNGTDKTLGRTSSSIIVNVPDSSNSGITINTEAYIMGVAHINTTNGYSTGESTGVKGNAIAYATQFDGEQLNTEALNDSQSLQLLKEDNVIKKSEHFKTYWDSNSGIHPGGIQLPAGTYSIGAVLKNDGTVGSSTLAYVPNEVKDKQKDFASKVYNLGGESLTDDNKQILYESLGSNKDLVSDLMNIEDTPEDYKNNNGIFFKNSGVETKDQENNNEKAIFSEKNIKIKESTEQEQSIVKDPDDENGIIINVPSNTTLNAFIATSGDITIKGKVDIKGSIIAEGKLTLEKSEDFNTNESKSIEYNKELLDRIQASNVEIFNSVFGHMRESNPVNLNVEYDVNKFINNGRWKIIK